MKEEIIVEPALAARPTTFRRISWQAIFGGLVTTLALQLLLMVLGVSLGLTAINSGAQPNSGENAGLMAAIWLIVISIISLFFGGWVSGRMSGLGRTSEGALQGLVTWGAATLLTVCLVTTVAGGILGGMGKLWAQMLPNGNPVVAQSAESQNTAQATQRNSPKADMTAAQKKQMDSMHQEARNIGQKDAATPTGRTSDNAVKTEEGASGQLVSSLDRLFSHGGQINPADREEVVNLLMTQDGMSRGQANQTVDRWIRSYKQAGAGSGPGIGDSVNSVSQEAVAAGWGSFVALLLGALAAMWGGSRGMAAFLRTRPKVTTVAAPA